MPYLFTEMVAFSRALFARYNDALVDFYTAGRAEQLVEAILRHLPRLVAVESTTFFPVNDDQWHFTGVVSRELDPALFDQYQAHYEPHDDYKRAVFARMPLPVVDRSSDYMDYAQWAKNPHRAEFLLPNGLYHLAGIQVVVNQTLIADLSFHRDRGPDFTDDEMVLFSELQRHISQAFARCLECHPTPLPLPPPLLVPQLEGAGLLRRLTLREVEILRLIARGRTNAEIAAQLDVSQNTVKTHLKHILAKTGCPNRTALAAVLYNITEGDAR